MYVCVHLWKYVYICTCAFVYVSLYVSMCEYIRICVCICVCMCTHVYMYVYAQIPIMYIVSFLPYSLSIVHTTSSSIVCANHISEVADISKHP